MKNRPTCCAPLKFNGAKGRIENLIPGFKARKCEGLKRDGTPCRDIAVTATRFCRHHNGKSIFANSAREKLSPKLVLIKTDAMIRRSYLKYIQYAAAIEGRENVSN